MIDDLIEGVLFVFGGYFHPYNFFEDGNFEDLNFFECLLIVFGCVSKCVLIEPSAVNGRPGVDFDEVVNGFYLLLVAGIG